MRARPDLLPTGQKNRREAVKLGPERIFYACRQIELGGDRRSNAKLGWTPVLRHVQVPRQRATDRWITPNSQLGQVAHYRHHTPGNAGVHPGKSLFANAAIHRTRYLLA
jgi:hypothetical protein